jgi:hypothetical protein
VSLGLQFPKKNYGGDGRTHRYDREIQRGYRDLKRPIGNRPLIHRIYY